MGRLVLIPISIVMIMGSPFVLWSAESQNRADDFESAEEIDSDKEQDGYIRIKGIAESKDDLSCPQNSEQSCIYVTSRTEEYKRSEENICSNSKPDGTILKNLEPKCDENGECTPCYLVELFKWDQIDSSSNEVDFTIGVYEIPSLSKANIQGADQHEDFIPVETQRGTTGNQNGAARNEIDDLVDEYYDEEISVGDEDPYYDYFEEDTIENIQPEESVRTKTNPREGDRLVSFNYIEEGEELIIVGESKDGEIFKDENEFVVSTLTYSETLDNLKAQDSGAKWGLRAVSFIMMVGGFMTLFGTIASIPLMLTRVIPWIGDDIKKGISGIVSFISGVVGLVLWGLIFAVISILKSPIALGIVILLIAAMGYYVWSKSKGVKVEQKSAKA